jgi:hypothetical protein
MTKKAIKLGFFAGENKEVIIRTTDKIVHRIIKLEKLSTDDDFIYIKGYYTPGRKDTGEDILIPHTMIIPFSSILYIEIYETENK